MESDAKTADQFLKEVTSEVGLGFIHRTVADRPYYMPSSIGSGAAFIDYDGDNRLDILLLQNGGHESHDRNQLFRQTEAGTFENVSEGSGVDLAAQGMGVAVGDVNNDGRPDLFITEYGQVRLLVNQSEGTQPRFIDKTAQWHIDNPFWGTSASFVDYDRDGWLDIVAVNYVNYDPSRTCTDSRGTREFCGPDGFPGRPTRLFRNLGRQSTSEEVDFEDVTIASGLAAAPGPGLGIFCADFDGDRWPDILISNDGKPNHLWMNQKDGTFKEEAALRGVGYNSMGKSQADMGIAIGDVNGDGRFDIFITHLTIETHTLWEQKSPGMFQDTTAASGILSAKWRGTGFGTVMADWDNNGWLDLSIVNGRVTRTTGTAEKVAPELDVFWRDYAERNQLFVNNGGGKFIDVSSANPDFSGIAGVSRGLACADFDSDGGMDALVTQVGGPAKLFRNVAPQRGHWLLVRATDPDQHRDAYGAEIRIQAGSQKWMRWINPAYSYLCSNDPRAHFGLGDISEYDSLTVIWPDGTEELFSGGQTNRVVEIVKGTGTVQ